MHTFNERFQEFTGLSPRWILRNEHFQYSLLKTAKKARCVFDSLSFQQIKAFRSNIMYALHTALQKYTYVSLIASATYDVFACEPFRMHV